MRQLGPGAILASLLLLLPLALAGAGCGDDDETAADPGAQDLGFAEDDAGQDAGTDAQPDADGPDAGGGSADPALFFAFGTEPDQPISAAPFPNDLYLAPDGSVALAPLQDDPRLGPLGLSSVLERFTALAAERTGFGSTSGAWLPTAGPPDPESLAGRVQVLTLSGPEAGRQVAVQTLYNEAFGAVGVFPAWGDYLMAGSLYGVVVTRGVRTAAGQEVEPHPAVAALVRGPAAGAPDAHLDPLWAPLREALSDAAIAPADVLVATVFTTQEVLPYARTVLEAVQRYELGTPSRRVRWDPTTEDFEEAPPIEGAALQSYYGEPQAPFEHNPGMWDWNRDHAEHFEPYGRRYDGGTPHPGIGLVQHGSVVVPALNMQRAPGGGITPAALRFVDGVPVAELNAMVPFTLYLCEAHLADPTNLPLAIYSHGGGAIRSNSSAWAAANCLAGVATLAIDMVFHGGRTATRLLDDESLIVPVTPDLQNVYTGLNEGDPGFERDWVGDRASSLDVVGALFAIWQGLDPGVVEANMLTIPADTATLLRYVQERDWSSVRPGLSFDSARIFHESLSFGTSFHTPLLVLSDDFAGMVGSVASGLMLSVNLLMAPSNSQTASAVAATALGLRTPPDKLAARSRQDPVLGLHQWLHERGDPLPYAPYVLRHRPTAPLPPVLHSGDSWDETLHGPAQITYTQALGLPLYQHGEAWTIDATLPGSDRLLATPAPAEPLSDNATFGEQSTTAAIYWYAGSCHGLTQGSICAQSYAHPYPPHELLEVPVVKPSPLCALHNQIAGFLTSILAGGPAEIVPPTGSCEEVYGGG